MSAPLHASYIQCRADEVGCRVYYLDDARFVDPVPVLAASRDDAEMTLREWGDAEAIARRTGARAKLTTKFRTCPHCDGEGVIED